jgi:aminoglycoside phosphotransferase (APT) family kinase protein
MLDVMPARPWRLGAYARHFAELHAGLHAKSVPDLPRQRERVEARVRSAPLEARWRDAALRLLDTLPDGDRLCHGDFHPANVILSGAGPVIIDWPDATSGNPLADVARTLTLIRFGPLAEPSVVRRTVFRAFSGLFRAAT